MALLLNLHSHLEGRVRPDTAAELGSRLGLPDPPGGWADALELDAPADLTVYLAKVASTYPFFGDPESLARITSEAVQDAAADGLSYLELRFGPATHVRPGFDLDAVIRAACAGARDGTTRSGMPAGIVVAALRHHDEAINTAVAHAAARAAGDGVVGFDLAGDELRFPDLAPYAEAFAIAAAADLGLTCHAAEAAPGPAAREAVERFGVRRIGHGTHVADDADTLDWIADHGVVVEVCPTSNLYTGGITRIADHPARTFLDHGVPIVLGDDNPRQTRSPLSAESALLQTVLGLDAADLAGIEATAVEVAFAGDAVRAAWRDH
ncbi:adenosine deaminase [Nakamurella deserti]|uniref:adenosine deaminase n=1 Tax=Nakamurella deserti TaxID=2164074 RepID=UPI000DBEA880|nr:adenosine deaminase [Nakamurella deserti]